MTIWQDYGIFLAKIIAATSAVLLIISRVQKGKSPINDCPAVTLTPLNKQFDKQQTQLLKQALSRKLRRQQTKASKTKKDKTDKPRLFVLHFTGDIKASQADCLRHEVTAILAIAQPNDEVLLCLESPGGSVPHYGFAASQLARLRNQNIKLTIAIDKMAASGGYLMACTANHIIAAPYAIIGSIGVVMQLPNFHKALKKRNVEFEQLTAGQHKRNLSMFGENTSAGRKKAQETIEEMHDVFKQTISHFRPQLDLKQVATGEYWLAAHAIDKGLIDSLQTSDDYLMQAYKTHEIFVVKQPKKPKLTDKFTQTVRTIADDLVNL